MGYTGVGGVAAVWKRVESEDGERADHPTSVASGRAVESFNEEREPFAGAHNSDRRNVEAGSACQFHRYEL